MDKTTFYWKVLGRINIYSKKLYNSANDRLALKMSRVSAHRWRQKHARMRGGSVLNQKLLREIKEYSKSRFGSPKYWPWLATYTEIKGEFVEGWIPYDYYRFKLINELNIDAFSRLSGIKTFDHRLFDCQVIEPEAICLHNRIYHSGGTVVSKNNLIKLLKELNCEIVIKPDEGSGGNNIHFIHSDEITEKHIPTTGSAIIQKVVEQHHLLEKVNPSSINTFRVLSSINRDGKVEIKFVYLRFGVGGSRLDNISRGGGWVYIFPNGRADDCSYNLEGFELVRIHPDTKVEFSTLSFPFYDKILRLCEKSHQKIPHASLIGWDVFINKEGIPKLIEWNAKNPFFWPVEARYGPFFKKI